MWKENSELWTYDYSLNLSSTDYTEDCKNVQCMENNVLVLASGNTKIRNLTITAYWRFAAHCLQSEDLVLFVSCAMMLLPVQDDAQESCSPWMKSVQTGEIQSWNCGLKLSCCGLNHAHDDLQHNFSCSWNTKIFCLESFSIKIICKNQVLYTGW